MTAAFAAGALLMAAGFAAWPAPPLRDSAPQRYSLALPEDIGGLHSLAISPDGRHLVISAQRDGRFQLLLRPLDALHYEPMRGSEGGRYPFWSPDSRYIGFFADGKLKKVPASGGPPQELCEVSDPRGGSWNRDDVIIFSPSGNAGEAIQRVSASGGTPADVTARVPGQLARFPAFLPDGRHFLYVLGGTRPAVLMASLEGTDTQQVLPDGSPGVSVAAARVLFIRANTLMAQPFDAVRGVVTGDPFPVADEVPTTTNVWSAPVSASETGVLLSERIAEPVFTIVDRRGLPIGGSEPAFGFQMAMAPDGSTAAFVRRRGPGQSQNIWVKDLVRGNERPLTSTGRTAPDMEPHWSPAGDRIVFASTRSGGVFNLYQRAASGEGLDELLLANEQPKHPSHWSDDGAHVVFDQRDPQTQRNLWVLPMTGTDRQPDPFLRTAADEFGGRLSPDGRWMAYTSDESGRLEVYVRHFSDGGGPWRISTGGGWIPRWRKDRA